MARRRVTDGEASSPYRRGIVREVDGRRAKARVEFPDEDGVVSFWLNVNQMAAGSLKVYAMPPVGSQVNCLVDWRGEDGTVLGGAYSDADAPPTENPQEIHLRGASGAGIILNLATGEITIDNAASVRIAAGEIVLDGPVSMPQGLTAGSGEGTAAAFAGAITAEGRIESKTEVVASDFRVK